MRGSLRSFVNKAIDEIKEEPMHFITDLVVVILVAFMAAHSNEKIANLNYSVELEKIKDSQMQSEKSLEKIQNQLDNDSTQLLKDFAIVLAEKPNTIAVFSTLRTLVDTDLVINSDMKGALESLVGEVSTYSNTQINRYVTGLFNDYDVNRQDSMTYLLHGVSKYNIEYFIKSCKEEIMLQDGRRDSDGNRVNNDTYNKAIEYIIYIFHCLDEEVYNDKDVLLQLNEFLNLPSIAESDNKIYYRYTNLLARVSELMNKKP